MSPGVTKGRFLAFHMALSVALMALLAGCQLLGAPSLEGFNEKLAGGYTAVTASRQAATELLRGNVITPEDAQNVQDQADNARRGLDIAKKLQGVDFKAADTRLESTLKIIDALTEYLNLRKKGALSQ